MSAQAGGHASTVGRFRQGMVPRTGGFNTVDYGAMNETTWLVTDALMFIGGGSGGTAGGIKVTTFAILGLVILAEARGVGDVDVDVAGRRIAESTQRQALSVALLGIGVVFLATLVLLATSDVDLDRLLFEALSAFGGVGLSTGITGGLPVASQVTLIVLMFVGRVGPVTLASALALRQQARLYRLPEERPLVG